MEKTESSFLIDENLYCKVCSEQNFVLRDGYYYCEECGTKQDQVMDVHVDLENEFKDQANLKTQKIKSAKTEIPDLTSWECYNYILRGLVEDLLSYGAKEELKLMTLQIWAAYLRRTEVAFFSKKQAVLPKLGLRFLDRDANTIYNYSVQKRKKRKRNTDGASSASGVSSVREWRRRKRQLDESAYSQSILSSDHTLSQLSANTSSSGTTGRAIQLRFSTYARKHLKKTIPVKHIAKHEMDSERNLTCHKLKPTVNSLKHTEHVIQTLNIRQIYTILAIALNLVEDDIQLTDFVRFIGEGHITTKRAVQYFPANIMPHAKKILQEIKFYSYPDKFTDKVLREHIGQLAKFIKIQTFCKPDILKLAFRYITDLNLPTDFNMYVERLINFLKPQMNSRSQYIYPNFEARAMAYVVFLLKLLFGLDGFKEKRISESGKRINKAINRLSKLVDDKNLPKPLFIWNEWVEYIEMRKVIVSMYNSNFCRQFEQCQSTEQMLEQIDEEQRRQNEMENLVPDQNPTTTKASIQNMQKIFQSFQQHYKSDTTKATENRSTLSFSPSFTPAHSYFKRILFHCSNGKDALISIPEFMHVDHTERSLQPLLEAKTLREFFKQHSIDLNIQQIPCTSNRDYVGIFRSPQECVPGVARSLRAQKADFNISEEAWLKGLKDEVDELEFKMNLDGYEKQYMKKLESIALKRSQRENEGMPDWLIANRNEMQERMKKSVKRSEMVTSTQIDNTDILSMHSLMVFSENDMDPIANLHLDAPRRELDTLNLFDGINDDDDVVNVSDIENSHIEKDSTSSDEDRSSPITLLRSNLDYWLLLGIAHTVKGVQKKVLENKFPRSFFWLLKTCAQTIGVEWIVLYEELLAIELMFAYGIEKIDNFRDCIRFKYNNPIKDINIIINSYRDIW